MSLHLSLVFWPHLGSCFQIPLPEINSEFTSENQGGLEDDLFLGKLLEAEGGVIFCDERITPDLGETGYLYSSLNDIFFRWEEKCQLEQGYNFTAVYTFAMKVLKMREWGFAIHH